MARKAPEEHSAVAPGGRVGSHAELASKRPQTTKVTTHLRVLPWEPQQPAFCDAQVRYGGWSDISLRRLSTAFGFHL